MRRLVLLAALLLAPLASAEAVVRLVDGALVPAEVHVATWEWVVWSWPEGDEHGLAPEGGGEPWCEHGQAAACRWFFREPGEYRYHDTLHPGVAGVVHVTRQGGEPGATLFVYFVYWRDGLTLTFDASPADESSTAIESYVWDFGDGTKGTGRIVEHTYPAPGVYQATLLVVDEHGREGALSRAVFAAAPLDPAVRFNATGNGRSVQFGSTPWNGTHVWDFGDGERAVCDPACAAPPGTFASSPTSLLHIYRRGGTFDVTHEVTDANGTRNVTAPVTVDAEETFSISTDGLRMEVDARHLPTYGDATYAWLFGDQARAEGAHASHELAVAGLWSVRLELRDEVGVQQLDREATLVAAEAPPPAQQEGPASTPIPALGLLAIALALTVAALKSERYK